MAGSPIGEKAPIGNTDCPIGYGLYPLASIEITDITAQQTGVLERKVIFCFVSGHIPTAFVPTKSRS